MPLLFTLTLAVVIIVVTMLLALTLGALVSWRPTLAGPIQAALGGIMMMIALMAVLVTVTR
ncbi:hypothetical protein QCN29_34315 [Streptomyces sp. HNM0663]|uniref:Uncharacterized protein n=1 Tax=Streptomyces chengmaiensis TaxID=3040919 RepID=A0ABT6HYK2_9ACTN|nr:hypothetical protein [Streptomyces chengmaiensis]MDH2393750.1 hypothetical protein [Streptomyces chengmaiensis]